MSSTSENKVSSSSLRGNARSILVNIKAQDGSLTRCEVGVDLPCERLFKKYCGKRDLEYRSVQFLYDGHRIKHRRTFNELGLGDEAEVEIDAMEHMPGGGWGL